ncbi:polyhydroxyalkanoate synthesis repressor PhaR [Azospirillum picis]|uniref:Polyhydroxyalkanoate synthesis repressor PhaR n=1 Tax=Azospirillum picis TaxID=488438 RepID=A0ABU0MKN9_9PROT|nr:polyhydroxyalkanoate synthesis repressor PhaR [Azospirillum picis]MBP2300120.1 polyhydroxyalkanoate synthesis repressor PhaR [Azospirillum picis]MDQ0534038.1 polyhydroxyalkanoate synthesis repressor PhaR [Azospirillum picis]
MADKEDQKSAPITIKKYANRRLYNTATSSYVTLDHLCQMVKDGLDFVVYDAKTGEDITRSVLTQIIVEEENKGQNLLPISFLRQLIGFYGDNMQSVVPRYLEYSMQAFSRNQEQMRDYFQNTLGGMFPFGRLDEVSKQNMAMFERAMRMFTPFGTAGAPDEAAGKGPAGVAGTAGGGQPGAGGPAAQAGASFDELQKQIDELQKQIASIARPGTKTEAK